MTSIPSPAGPLQLLDFRSARPPAALRLAGSNGGETTGRGLRRIAVEAPRDWRPPNPSPMNLSLEGRNPLRPLPRTGKFRRIFRARQSPAIPHWRLSFRLAAPPAALTLAGSNRSETSCGGGGLVSSAAARRRFSQARPGSPANRLRHSTSAGSGYTQLPVIRKGNVRKLARWKRSSRRRAAGCPKRRQVAALESGPFDASPLGNATGRSGLRVSNSFVKATKLTTRFTTKFAPGFVPQAAIRLSLS